VKKRIIVCAFLVLIFLCITSTVSFAATSNIETINKEFIFDDNIEQIIKNKIEEDLLAEKVDAKLSILCLFGHKKESGTVSVITHRARPSAPRCLREVFQYEICTRCDYSKYDRMSFGYIFCCN